MKKKIPELAESLETLIQQKIGSNERKGDFSARIDEIEKEIISSKAKKLSEIN